MLKNSTEHQLKIIIERDEDGYFVASVPALPGCHTQAKTLPALMRRVRDAVCLCLEVSQTNPNYRTTIRQFAYEPAFVGIEVITL